MHFNTTRRVLTFTVDEDKFETKPAIAAGVVFGLQSSMKDFKSDNDTNRDKAYENLKQTYKRILSAESWALFEPRIDGDCDDDVVPIDALQLFEITRWVLGEGLGKGHSQPASSSQGG